MSAGRRWSDAGRTRHLGSYTLVTLQSSCRINRAVSVFTMLDNVLNAKYEVLPGYPMPGTNAIGGFSLSF